MKAFFATVIVVLAIAAGTVYLQQQAPRHGRFDDVAICFILAGSREPSQPYTNRVWQGVLDAQHDLGCRVDIRETNWERDRIVAMIDTAITLGDFDAICIPGFPQQDEFIPFVDEAYRQKIIVTGYGVPIPALEAAYAKEGFGRVGGDGYFLGERLAQRMIAKFGLKARDRVLLIGSVSEKGRGDVAQAGLDVLGAAGVVVDYIDLELERQGDPPQYAKQVVADYLNERTDFDAIFFEASNVDYLVAALEDAGVEAGRYQIASVGVNAQSLACIQNGYVGLLASGDPYLHGYMPVLQACLTTRYGLGGMRVDAPVYYVDEENVDTYVELVEQGLR